VNDDEVGGRKREARVDIAGVGLEYAAKEA